MRARRTLAAVPIAPPEPGGPQRLFTLDEIGKAWGCSRAFVYGFVVRGELRAIVLPSKGKRLRGRILIDPKDLDAFLEARKTEAA